MPIPPRRPQQKSDNKMNDKIFTFEEGTQSGAYLHLNLTMQKVGILLENLKYSNFKEKHKLHLPRGYVLVGYDAIKQFYNQSTELPKTEDHILNPVLQEPIKTDFIREVDILRLVTEIQSLATKPGNEKRIHELSSVLKYVMSPESTSTKPVPVRGVKLYEVRYMNGQHPAILEVLACDHKEALEMFYARKIPYSMVLNTNVKK